jgi:hypothetical protein
MRSIKFILVLFLIFIFCLPVTGEKRYPKKSMKELTDPNSPSYVPYPYPKKREEIVADLYYYIEKFCKPSEGVHESYVDGKVPIQETILLNLLEPEPSYKIGKIIKVKNRAAELPDNYTWLVLVMDNDGNIALRAALMADGLVASYGTNRGSNLKKASEKYRKRVERLQKIRSDKEIKNILSESLDHVVEDQEIKKMERIAYLANIGDILLPLWEIKMTNGKIYYYSENRDMIYSIEKKLPWKKNSNGRRKGRAEMAQNRAFLPDTVNDEFVILNEIPRKKKD